MRTPALLAGLLSIALLTGCTMQSPGTPRPTPNSSESEDQTQPPTSSEDGPPETDLPANGAPDVEDPLDISRFVADPCLVLTSTQAQGLNVPTQGTPTSFSLGKGCDWTNRENLGSTTIAMSNNQPLGLTAQYTANKDGKYQFFEEISPIEDYPAIAFDVVDRRDRGACSVAVGVANDLSFTVFLTLSTGNIDKKDPCESASIVAGMMMKTMKATS